MKTDNNDDLYEQKNNNITSIKQSIWWIKFVYGIWWFYSSNWLFYSLNILSGWHYFVHTSHHCC